MSSIADKYFEAAKDYGRKSYRTDDDMSFGEYMKKKTFFMFDAQYKAPFSEFEKPYLEDDYNEMEQMLQDPPGFWGLPDIPWSWPDNPSFPPGAQENPPGGDGFIVFWCSITGCWCPGQTRTVHANCSHEITAVSLASPTARLAAKDFSISAKPGGTSATITITADEEAEGAVELDIDMKAGSVRGSHDSIMVTSCPDCDLCDQDTVPVEWDSENSPETLNQGDTVQIFVLNGVAPFTWEVTVCGNYIERCTVQNSLTEGRTNFLHVASNACGGVQVKVTDACETETYGSLKITAGRWSACDVNNIYNASGCTCSCGNTYVSYGWGDRCDGRVHVPYTNTPCMYLSATQRYVSKCGGACCGPDCGPEACIVGPVSCGGGFYFPCLDPCGGQNHLMVTDWAAAEVWQCE